MAEAAVENPDQTENSKFYCHQCSVEIRPTLPDFTCPRCQNGFIEEISDDTNLGAGTSQQQQQQQHQQADPAAQFAEIWGRALIESFSDHTGERDEGVAWARDRDSDEEEGENLPPRRRQREYQPSRVTFRRTRPLRNQYLQGLLQYFSERLDGDVGAGAGGFMQGIPINIVPLQGIHGNPQDYVWGAGGLDAIITQLLNQLEGAGAPPADTEKIDALPTVHVNQTQVDNVLQCSVCMEDFKLGEEVRRLPCDHHFHNDCIVPWLRMHGTCPVCRKDLNGDDTSLKNTITPIVDSSNSDGGTGT